MPGMPFMLQLLSSGEFPEMMTELFKLQQLLVFKKKFVYHHWPFCTYECIFAPMKMSERERESESCEDKAFLFSSSVPEMCKLTWHGHIFISLNFWVTQLIMMPCRYQCCFSSVIDISLVTWGSFIKFCDS